MAPRLNSVDQTLEIVKDAEKFKARIEELAKAQRAADKSTEKAQARNKELFAEYDAKKKAGDAAVSDAKARVVAADKSVAEAMAPVVEARAQVNRLNVSVKNREDRLKRDLEKFENDRIVLFEASEEFNQKVETFKNAVTSACSNVVG